MTERNRPCNGCEERCVGCHGRNPDGTWRCSRWAAEQERVTAERRRTDKAWRGERVTREYTWDSKQRYINRKKRGH